jgi:hypothetical protein
MKLTLTDIIDVEVAKERFPFELHGVTLKTAPPPRAVVALNMLARIGILNGDGMLALIAQAPIDPVNLMGTLMRLLPDGWVFSAIDFAMMRILARSVSDTNTVTAAMHVDLMGDTIKYLARNKAGQLTLYKEFKVTPSPTTWNEVQALIVETVSAGDREAGA